jgi:fructose-specific phosphotransferase system IIC component
MLKYIKQHMASISGIEIYPLISFGIFFLFFLAVTYLVIKADKNHIQTLSNMPLEDEE